MIGNILAIVLILKRFNRHADVSNKWMNIFEKKQTNKTDAELHFEYGGEDSEGAGNSAAAFTREPLRNEQQQRQRQRQQQSAAAAAAAAAAAMEAPQQQQQQQQRWEPQSRDRL